MSEWQSALRAPKAVHQAFMEQARRIVNLESKLARYEAALRKYGKHEDDCDLIQLAAYPEFAECDCGLGDTLLPDFTSPDFIEGTKQGVADVKAGRVRRWADVRKELNLD